MVLVEVDWEHEDVDQAAAHCLNGHGRLVTTHANMAYPALFFESLQVPQGFLCPAVPGGL